MATGVKFYCLTENIAEAAHNLGSDTLKIMLTNVAPALTNTVFADLTEITAGFGYTAGGTAVTITASSQTTGTYKLVGNDVVFTAAGGTMATFRYVVLYNDTSASDKLIGYWDNGSTISLADTESFTVDFSAANGILQIA